MYRTLYKLLEIRTKNFPLQNVANPLEKKDFQNAFHNCPTERHKSGAFIHQLFAPLVESCLRSVNSLARYFEVTLWWLC